MKGETPWWPSGWDSVRHCRGTGLIPCQGTKISYVVWAWPKTKTKKKKRNNRKIRTLSEEGKLSCYYHTYFKRMVKENT